MNFPADTHQRLQIYPALTAEHFQHARQLITEMARWDAEESRKLGVDPIQVLSFFYSNDDDKLVRESVPPQGTLLIAAVADQPAGCAGFRRLEANICELHNLYVRDEFRGRSIARLMLERLISAAIDAGYRAMRLETASFMTEAQALYASFGFRSRVAYRTIPKAFEPWTLPMELTLVAKSR